MLTGAQNFRLKMIELVKKTFGSSYTQYRFNNASNFVNYEQYLDEEAIDSIISLGEELARIKRFKDVSNEMLLTYVHSWYDLKGPLDEHDTYLKQKGIEAKNELQRRNNEAYFNSQDDTITIKLTK